MLRLALLALVIAPSIASADPADKIAAEAAQPHVRSPIGAAAAAFTRDELMAAYALGHADAAREAASATPAALSMAEKMKAALEKR